MLKYLKCLVEFTTEPIWPWWFLFWEVINYWFNFLSRYRSTHIIWGRTLTAFYEFGGLGGLVAKSCPTLATPWTVAHQALLSMGFCRQEYWSVLLFPSPGDLPNSGVEPRSPVLQVDSLPAEPQGKPTLKWDSDYVRNVKNRCSALTALQCQRAFPDMEKVRTWDLGWLHMLGWNWECVCVCVRVHTRVRVGVRALSCSVVSNSLRPHGL